MRYAFILNPAAQSGRAGRRRRALEAALRAKDVDFTITETEAPGHAERLARAVAQSAEVIVAVGGDGTNQEVARGVHGTGATMGVLPLGTGNDFAHAVGMPDDLQAAVSALLTADAVPVDLGRVRWQERADGGDLVTHEAFFTNCIGAGFDALAAVWARRYKRLGGRTAYVAAVLRALWQWRQPDMHVEIRASMTTDGRRSAAAEVAVSAAADQVNGPPSTVHRAPSTVDPIGLAPDEGTLLHEGGLFLVELCNGFSVGGGLLLTPDAQVDDGLFDLCLVEHVTTRRALRLLPKTFSGGHIGEPEVVMDRVRRLTVRSSVPLPMQADGEVLSNGAHAFDVAVLPGALSFRAPKLRHSSA
ncbi:MAG: hypothetical protein HKN04_00235 [Rhodothermaceae bacterium]|nr:hypothetical protein [Rhodothermaceae bacterium]